MKEAALRPQGLRERRKSLVALACSSVLALGLYVFLEWLFLVTRPSFFSALSWFERLRILLAALGVVLVPLLGLVLLLLVVFRWLPRAARRTTAALIPAVTLSCTALLLVDNFTYTLFDVGLKTIDGWWRGLYLLFLLTAVAIVFRRILGAPRGSASPAYLWPAGLIVLAATLALVSHWWHDPGVVLGEGSRRPG